jgi:catechol 2,3-dioxygenase-like lactoylglutathione lyase family enzyme
MALYPWVAIVRITLDLPVPDIPVSRTRFTSPEPTARFADHGTGWVQRSSTRAEAGIPVGAAGEFRPPLRSITVKAPITEEEAMPTITKIGRVVVPVADQDEAIRFYTQTLGFTLAADIPFGEGDRWVEVAPPGGGTAIALVTPQGEYQPGRMTGIALESRDPRADHAELQGKGVDVDAQLMGGDGTVPLLFFFRDSNKNQLMIVQAQ